MDSTEDQFFTMNLYCARLLLLRSFICSETNWGRGVAAAKIDEAWDEKEIWKMAEK